jgi:hypothetical protein
VGAEQEHDLGGNEWSTSDRYFTHIEMALPLTLHPLLRRCRCRVVVVLVVLVVIVVLVIIVLVLVLVFPFIASIYFRSM